jgi:hypothetical protein
MCSPPEPPSDNAKRDLEIEYYDPAGNGTLVRRTIKMPQSGSDDDMAEYIHGEIDAKGFKKIAWSAQHKKKTVDMNTAKAVEFNSKKPVSIGTGGLCGCTVLAIVSKKGVYMGHYWESISFYPDPHWTKVYKGTEKDVFENTVIKGLKDGIRSQAGGSWDQPPLTDYKHLFDGEDTQAFLMFPKSADHDDVKVYKEKYQPRWKQMKETINEILPVLKGRRKWRDYKYDPARDRKTQEQELAKARGTVVLKYDPNDKPGNGDVKSRKRMVMWMEEAKTLDEIWDEKK